LVHIYLTPNTLDDGSQHPALGTAGGHKQVEATAVGDPSGAVSRLRGLHSPCGEGFLRVSAALLFPH